MTFSPLVRVASLTAFIAALTMTAGAWPHKASQKVRVRFWASSTLVRGTWGLNEDTYLAEMHLRSDGESILVRLIDEYPNEAPSLSRAILTSESWTTLHLWRDSQCDSAYSQMLLRAAPGDLTAILPIQLEYHPTVDKRVKFDTILPCYRTTRGHL